MTLAEAEADISDMLKDASANYEGDPEAKEASTMHLACVKHGMSSQRGLH